MKNSCPFGLDDIMALLPHRPPFLFVDQITRLIPGQRIEGELRFEGTEFFFAGHFPGKPIVPGVIITDALAQTAGLLWGFSKKVGGEAVDTAPKMFYLAAAQMKFRSPGLPKETIALVAEAGTTFGTLLSYTVEATAGRRIIAQGTLTLAMAEEKP